MSRHIQGSKQKEGKLRIQGASYSTALGGTGGGKAGSVEGIQADTCRGAFSKCTFLTCFACLYVHVIFCLFIKIGWKYKVHAENEQITDEQVDEL